MDEILSLYPNLYPLWKTFFNKSLEEFTNTKVFQNQSILDKELLLKDKKEKQITIWENFQNNLDVFENCIYNGLVYRILDCRKAKIYYDNFITHWTSNYESFISMVKGFNKNKRYSWIIANIKNGFSVNNYYEYHNYYCEFECEIIYPMSKDVVINEFYGTYNEFIIHLQKLHL